MRKVGQKKEKKAKRGEGKEVFTSVLENSSDFSVLDQHAIDYASDIVQEEFEKFVMNMVKWNYGKLVLSAYKLT